MVIQALPTRSVVLSVAAVTALVVVGSTTALWFVSQDGGSSTLGSTPTSISTSCVQTASGELYVRLNYTGDSAPSNGQIEGSLSSSCGRVVVPNATIEPNDWTFVDSQVGAYNLTVWFGGSAHVVATEVKPVTTTCLSFNESSGDSNVAFSEPFGPTTC